MTPRNTIESIVACAIRNGLSLGDINGRVEAWAEGCRDKDGNRPSTEAFRAEWERQLIPKEPPMTAQPCPPVEDE